MRFAWSSSSLNSPPGAMKSASYTRNNLSLLKTGMGFKKEERVRVRIEFLRMLTRLRLDPARMELIGSFFESYLRLNQQEEEEFRRELGNMDKKEVETLQK